MDQEEERTTVSRWSDVHDSSNKLSSLRAELQEIRNLFPLLLQCVHKNSLNIEEQDELARAFKRAAAQYVRARHYVNSREKVMDGLGLILSVSMIATLFAVINSPSVAFIVLLGTVVCHLSAALAPTRLGYPAFLIAQTCGGYLLLQRRHVGLRDIYLNTVSTSLSTKILFGLTLGPAVGVGFAAVYAIREAIQKKVHRRIWRSFARSGIAINLIFVLKIVRNNTSYAEQLHSEALPFLAVAADLLRVGLPRNIKGLRSKEAFTVSEQLAASARMVNTYRVPLLFPTPETRKLLCDQIAEITVCILLGNFGALPRESVIAGPAVPRLERVARVARLLVVALLPPVAVYAAKALGLAFPPGVSNTASLAATLWTVVVILTILDPELEHRITLMRKIISLARKDDSTR
jgi:hypothetical protein